MRAGKGKEILDVIYVHILRHCRNSGGLERRQEMGRGIRYYDIGGVREGLICVSCCSGAKTYLQRKYMSQIRHFQKHNNISFPTEGEKHRKRFCT